MATKFKVKLEKEFLADNPKDAVAKMHEELKADVNGTLRFTVFAGSISVDFIGKYDSDGKTVTEVKR